jgi:hypothetical protein
MCSLSLSLSRTYSQPSSYNISVEMPHRRATIAWLFERMRPGHGPERGGTLRDDDSVSTGTSPEALTQWNIPEDMSPRSQAELAQAKSPPGHRRAISLGPQRHVLKANDAPGSVPDPFERHEMPAPNFSRPVHRGQPDAVSASEVHAMLRAKEKSQLERRKLKASGDYLPVTGFDPVTGEWEVLTPTDSLRSDPISPRREDIQMKLALELQQAELAYEQAKNRLDTDNDKLRLEKTLAKLTRLQIAKEKVKHDSDRTKWSRHGGNWLSATEPDLSPIAQSLSSYAPSSYAPSSE